MRASMFCEMIKLGEDGKTRQFVVSKSKGVYIIPLLNLPCKTTNKKQRVGVHQRPLTT